jgi:hypothetical protein
MQFKLRYNATMEKIARIEKRMGGEMNRGYV